MTSEITTVIVAVITPILTAVTSYLVYVMKTNHKENSEAEKAMMILLRRELREQYNVIKSKQSVSIEELEEFDEIYEVYHALGGNGTGTKMHEYVHSMKVKG